MWTGIPLTAHEEGDIAPCSLVSASLLLPYTELTSEIDKHDTDPLVNLFRGVNSYLTPKCEFTPDFNGWTSSHTNFMLIFAIIFTLDCQTMQHRFEMKCK